MSFLKKLFGLSSASDAPAAQNADKSVDYNGYTIRATPYMEGGQYQLCGVISKEVDGVLKEHRFVRADRTTSLDDISEMALAKGRQMIDQQGMRIFK